MSLLLLNHPLSTGACRLPSDAASWIHGASRARAYDNQGTYTNIRRQSYDSLRQQNNAGVRYALLHDEGGPGARYSADLLVYTSRGAIRPRAQSTQTANLTAPSPLESSDFRRVAEGLSTSPTTPRQS
jgi:hypothetical protein